ncbi:MAG: hydrogenase maturation protease [candidate division KSB1 bacterium]|nr:hydrogenase maturation protease [candidate division KSB1 bacterium]
MHTQENGKTTILILGIGNILMGDEGVGCQVVQHIQSRPLPEGIECLDGGTGGFHLLDAMQQADHILLVDATVDGRPPGSVLKLRPQFSSDYPRTLTAHDIGLKDMLDAFHLLGRTPRVTLFAVSIKPLGEMSTELSPEISSQISHIAEAVLKEAKTILAENHLEK